MSPQEELEALTGVEEGNLRAQVNLRAFLDSAELLYRASGGDMSNARRILQVAADIELCNAMDQFPIPDLVGKLIDWRKILREHLAERVGYHFDRLFPNTEWRPKYVAQE